MISFCSRIYCDIGSLCPFKNGFPVTSIDASVTPILAKYCSYELGVSPATWFLRTHQPLGMLTK